MNAQNFYSANSDTERKDLIRTIKNGSVIAWPHISLQGKYDFPEEVLKNSIKFWIPNYRGYKWFKMGNETSPVIPIPDLERAGIE